MIDTALFLNEHEESIVETLRALDQWIVSGGKLHATSNASKVFVRLTRNVYLNIPEEIRELALKGAITTWKQRGRIYCATRNFSLGTKALEVTVTAREKGCSGTYDTYWSVEKTGCASTFQKAVQMALDSQEKEVDKGDQE